MKQPRFLITNRHFAVKRRVSSACDYCVLYHQKGDCQNYDANYPYCFAHFFLLLLFFDFTSLTRLASLFFHLLASFCFALLMSFITFPAPRRYEVFACRPDSNLSSLDASAASCVLYEFVK